MRPIRSICRSTRIVFGFNCIMQSFSLEQQQKWDRGEDWSRWAELVEEIPEMANTRISLNLQTKFPFKDLRSSAK
jgi:hypothetical protein